MRHYTQLAKDQRYQIYAFLKTKYSYSVIAKEFRRSKSTLSRELKHNPDKKEYQLKQEYQMALSRHEKVGHVSVFDYLIKHQVIFLPIDLMFLKLHNKRL